MACILILSLPLEAIVGQAIHTLPQKYLSQYSIRSWSVAEGLPQSSARAIIQTRDGYIWFGTQEGLVRFDGVHFTVFDSKNTPAIPHNEVVSLLEQEDGTLLIGTFGGLASLKNGQFTLLSRGVGQGLMRIQSMCETSDGSLWIGCMGDGLFKYSGGQFRQYTVNDGLSTDIISSVCADSEGALWIGSNAGVMKLKENKFTFIRAGSGLPSDDVSSLCVARDSSVWIGTSSGLVRYRKGSFWIYTKKNGLSDNTIRCVYEDRKGSIWVGTEFGGIDRVTPAPVLPTGAADGLPGDFVFSVFEDREGNLWVGTYTDGINRLWKGNFAHIAVEKTLLRDNPISILETRSGAVWIGTISGGATRIAWNSVQKFDVSHGFPSDMVRSIAQDTKGDIWLGTRSGVVRYRDGTMRTYTTRDGLSNDYVRSLLALPDGSLWLGTVRGTIDIYKDGKFSPVKNLGLSNTIVRAMFRDREGNIWIGHNGGMIRWKANEVTTFNPADGCPTTLVYAFYQDAEGTIWIGTYGGGLYRLKAGKFAHITTSVGLFDDVVFQILEDDSDNLWMTCNRGIFRADRKQLNDFADGKIPSISCVSYGTSDGMLSSECNGNAQPAGYKMRDGRLLFPTAKGVVVVDPHNLKKNSIPPPVAIEKAVIDDRAFVSTLPASVSPGNGDLEFQYAGLSYVAPEKVKFKYQLIGYDEGWKDAGTRRTAIYTNIPHGKYVFKVIACNNDGVWNSEGASFSFELAPHFYETSWFLALCGVVAFGLIFAAYRVRVWRLLQREEILKQRVEESLAKIKILGGLIPICANCKKIRDDKGYWNKLEAYLHDHSEATFTHGLCPDCMEKLYGVRAEKGRGERGKGPASL